VYSHGASGGQALGRYQQNHAASTPEIKNLLIAPQFQFVKQSRPYDKLPSLGSIKPIGSGQWGHD
jgi:hypothetical protein